ncbi:MAG: citrate (Si)-synthase [Candidatus Glassbacteria bacterium]|nr:citrate (Si)-synthase [Candidatus Glassbacteria bacterium]
MNKLKEKLAAQIPALRDELKGLIGNNSDKKISEVTVQQLWGGMRGVKSLFCDTSVVEPEKGLIIRGKSILELADRLPEEIFILLLTGELPSKDELKDFQATLDSLPPVEEYVWDIQRSLPADTHPMIRLSIGILSLEKNSKFRARYTEGMQKADYWEPALEDSMVLLHKIPELAAGIYRIHTGKGDPLHPKTGLDMGANYAYMLGIPDPNGEFANLMRLYLVLHSDHEGGNVSALTTHVVGSALSDPYYAVSAGLNGLAGPLHGLANQECLDFVLHIEERFNGVPSEQELIDFCWETLNSGKVIPGYGHAVLRTTDPRFTAFREFGLKHCQDSKPFQIVDMMFRLVPDVLKEHGKAKNPYPNVDAGSGCLLYYYGLAEFDYYTVLFGVSRAMGMLSQLVINRAMGAPIFRPKSVGRGWVKSQVS